MRSPYWQLGVPEGVILFGASIFILVLGVSAFWEPDIRWLHFFQSWMYLATIALSLRGNRWGYFIGISAAGLWDYINIFATTFFYNGLQQLNQWFHHWAFGQTRSLDRSTRMVLQFTGGYRLLVGLCA